MRRLVTQHTGGTASDGCGAPQLAPALPEPLPPLTAAPREPPEEVPLFDDGTLFQDEETLPIEVRCRSNALRDVVERLQSAVGRVQRSRLVGARTTTLNKESWAALTCTARLPGKPAKCCGLDAATSWGPRMRVTAN